MRTAFTTLALLVSIAGVALTFIRIRKPMKVRPNFDLIRIAIALVTIVVITAVSSIGTAPAIAVVSTALGLGGGFLIGKQAEIWDEDGKLWLKRAGIGLIVWGASTVLLQAATIANRTELVDLGRFGAWFGIGMQVGVFVGRMEPLALARAAAAASVAGAVWFGLPQPSDVDAQNDEGIDIDDFDPETETFLEGDVVPTDDRWVLVDTIVAPMDGFTTFSHSSGSITATIEFEDLFASTFNARYEPPPDVLEPGSTLVMNLAVTGAVTVGETQQYSGLDVIQYTGQRWTDAAVGADASCTDPIGSEPLSCIEPQANMGIFTWDIPDSAIGLPLEIGVGALNCDCAIHWVYEFEEAATPAVDEFDQSAASNDGAGFDESGDDEFIFEDTFDAGADDPFDDETGLDAFDEAAAPTSVDDGLFPEVEDEDKVGAAGALGTAAAAGVTLAEGRSGGRRRDGDGDDPDGDDRDPHPDDPPEGAVIDENGDVLLPDDDGLYPWGYGDDVRMVPRDELEELIDEARTANAERDARHDRIVAEQQSDAAAQQRLDELTQRSREDDEIARNRLREELERAGRADLTRQRVADHLADQAANGGWDAIADRLAQGDSLTRDELLEIAAVLERLAEQQGSVDPQTTGTYLGDLADEFGQDAAMAQEIAARLAEQQGGPVAGWIVRNPVAAGRIGAAVATGGFSEGLLTPLDVMNAMERAAARAHAEGRDLTYAEALAAAGWEVGPGMVFGALAQAGLTRYGSQLAEAASESFDSATRQVDDWVRAGARSGDEVAEAVARSGDEAVEGVARSGDDVIDPLARTGDGAVEGVARSGDDAVDAGADSAARTTPSADELAEEAARGTDPDNWPGVDNVKPGTKIPPEHIRETGYTPHQAAELQRVASEESVIFGTRETNRAGTKFIESGEGVPKPIWMKPKTINELDEALGGPPKELSGQVGFFEPRKPPPGSSDKLIARYEERLAQWNELEEADLPAQLLGWSTERLVELIDRLR
ncbi:MAG: hypothetical protein AAFY28_14730, partial [Actinomycetota bacterium]